MPAIVQGQERENSTERLGIAEIQNQNANTLQRRIAREVDDHLIEPLILRHYDWLMQYGEDEDEKGLYVVRARGSSVLVERDIQARNMLQMAPMVLNPTFEMDPVKYRDELLRSQKLDPDRFKLDTEKLKQMQEAAAQQPQDPRIAVEQMRSQIAAAKLQQDAQLEQMRLQFEAAQAEADRKVQILIEGMQHEVTSAEAQGNRVVEIAKLRAKLAEVTATETNKRNMAREEMALARTKGEGI
jgi:hypothetical protein